MFICSSTRGGWGGVKRSEEDRQESLHIVIIKVHEKVMQGVGGGGGGGGREQHAINSFCCSYIIIKVWGGGHRRYSGLKFHSQPTVSPHTTQSF